jgi:PTH1 family peptidyl-tRNA hydrolase
MEIKMKIIIGLGNPDAQYKNTFHNLGFMCADQVAEKLGLTFNKSKCRAQIAEGNINGQKVIIAKPQTYMNLSGESVESALSFYKIPLENLIVIYDDLDVDIGKIRIRKSGSAGTHNGMRNIVLHVNGTNFPRIRIGCKPVDFKGDIVDYVLSNVKSEDKPLFDDAIDRASSAVQEFLKGTSLDVVMNRFNG